MDPQHPLQHSHHSTPNPTIVQYPMVTLLQRQQHPPSHNKVVPQPIDSSNFLGPAQNLSNGDGSPQNCSTSSSLSPQLVAATSQPPSLPSKSATATAATQPVAARKHSPRRPQQQFARRVHNKFQQQNWQGKGSNTVTNGCVAEQPQPATIRYNYAQRKDVSEKTPMCRLAELARYNKLKHEYVLLDESGPAHRKKFTVKLVLCPGQEFEGNGPSIKKAQQAAAQVALDHNGLLKPASMLRNGCHLSRRTTSNGKRDDPKSAISLLTSVASQLGIGIQCREECLMRNKTSPGNFVVVPQQYAHATGGTKAAAPNFPLLFSPLIALSPTKHSSSAAIFAQPQLLPGSPNNIGNNTMLDLSAKPGLLPLVPPPYSLGFRSLAAPATSMLYPPPLPGVPPFLPFAPLPPPPMLFCNNNNNNNSLAHQQQQNLCYKVTIVISSDGSQHQGMGPTLAIAKQKAATHALAHLRPELERLKRAREEAEKADQNKGSETNDQNEGRDGSEVISGSSSRSSNDNGSRSPSLSPPTAGDQQEDGSANRDDVHDENDGEENDGENTAEPAEDAIIQANGQAQQQQRSNVRRQKHKSVISQIHECALRLKMNVEFQVLAELGEPHNRQYTVSVRLISAGGTGLPAKSPQEFVAEGHGMSKKAAKQAACQQLLGQVQHLLEADPVQLASSIVRQTANCNNGGLRRTGNCNGIVGPAEPIAQRTEFGGAKRRTIIKDKKMDPNYGSGVNPISRLIQVMQAHGERDPHFQVISEQGQNRHKEFTMAVHCAGQEEAVQGTGPNKKLAKRAAAEAMLARMGYVKPMPQPGKSLLKRRTELGSPAATSSDNNRNGNNGSGSPDRQNATMPDIGVFSITSDNEDGVAEQPAAITRIPIPQQLETFADVEQQWALRNNNNNNNKLGRCATSPEAEADEEQRANWVNPAVSPDGSNSTESPDRAATVAQRRRVTFSDTVRACPPPEASLAVTDYTASGVAEVTEQLAPLKSSDDDAVTTRPKRRSKKDSQRVLNAEESRALADAARLFLAWPGVEAEKRGLQTVDEEQLEPNKLKILSRNDLPMLSNNPATLPDKLPGLPGNFTAPINNPESLPNLDMPHNNLLPPPATFQPQFVATCSLPPPPQVAPQHPPFVAVPNKLCRTPSVTTLLYEADNKKLALIEAKQFLEKLAATYAFSVVYSDFPKTRNDEPCFSLVTLGLAKPIICHGSGSTEFVAHNDAALNAIRKLLLLDEDPVAPSATAPPP